VVFSEKLAIEFNAEPVAEGGDNNAVTGGGRFPGCHYHYYTGEEGQYGITGSAARNALHGMKLWPSAGVGVNSKGGHSKGGHN
jgi:hypothetical protein